MRFDKATISKLWTCISILKTKQEKHAKKGQKCKSARFWMFNMPNWSPTTRTDPMVRTPTCLLKVDGIK